MVSNPQKSPVSSPSTVPLRRKPVRVTEEGLTRSYILQQEKNLPLVIEATMGGVHLRNWAAGHRDRIEAELATHGAILFRGFALASASELQELITEISGEPMEYSNRSTPRSPVSGRIYTSTEYPADQSIPLHNEMSYATGWPERIFFLCVKSAEGGGETPIADSRRVFERIDPSVRETFTRKGVMYVRNFGHGLDLPWQEVFQTSDPAEVEAYCRNRGIGFEWKQEGGLRTWQTCQAVLSHARTGEMVWFNQAHLFHVSSLAPDIQELLLSIFAPEDLPRNAFYGDKSPIEPHALDDIRHAYSTEQVLFPWRNGDVLMMDNVLAAHGRSPFVGERRVVVGMSQPSAPM